MTFERLVMAGLDPKARRAWNAPMRDAAAIARSLGAPVAGLVELRTCERLEIYASGAIEHPADLLRAAGVHAPPAAVHTRRGAQAIRHLLRVAAGLESRLVGEPHVLGQVRRAANAAREAGVIGDELTALFTAAVRCGRRVRSETSLGRAALTYASLAAERVVERLADPSHARVAVIGSGAVAFEVGLDLHDRGVRDLTFVARHEGRTAVLAARLGAQSAPLADLRRVLRDVDAVITAISVQRPIVRAADLPRTPGALFVVDLGMPPNVEESACAARGAAYVGLDGLAPAQVPLSSIVEEAEDIVEDELERLTRGHRALTRPGGELAA